MRKLITLAVALMISSICFAQNDVTKFLGIPVDGTKSAMIQKLKDKGYTYNSRKDCLEGEFNGRNVEIYVVTNNNKVYRIAVKDKYGSDKTQIKISFNKLCRQFESNKKYMEGAPIEDFIISDNEDISYELIVHKKSYQAVFAQVPNSKEGLIEEMEEYAKTKVTKEEFDALSESEKTQLYELLQEECFNQLKEKAKKKIVWFTISEEYGDYYIIIYYDNLNNQANGEDL